MRIIGLEKTFLFSFINTRRLDIKYSTFITMAKNKTIIPLNVFISICFKVTLKL